MVDLSYYARSNIPNYEIITEIPQDNLAYLNSGLIATNMIYMFSECNNLKTIPKLNIDTSQCVNMEYMFDNCNSLASLDLSNFNTNNVTDMGYMFCRCESLTSLDLSNFDTSKVTDMFEMFYNCKALKHIEGIIDMKSCTNYRLMFGNCSKLSGVKIKNPPTDFELATRLNSSQYEIVS